MRVSVGVGDSSGSSCCAEQSRAVLAPNRDGRALQTRYAYTSIDRDGTSKAVLQRRLRRNPPRIICSAGFGNVGRRLFIAQASSLAVLPLAYASSPFGLDVVGQSESTVGVLDPLLSLLGAPQLSRPAPVRIPRGGLFRAFAVLLMRTSYEAADDLDFVPMDRFQKEFFLLRADEWEKYREETDSQQGDLSNALYFDFISAAQYATISTLMRDGQSMFEERLGADGAVRAVRRDPAVTNAMLPALFFERAGDRILDAIYTNFTGPDFYTQPPAPCPAPADLQCVVDGLQQLYKVFYENGYAKEVFVADGGSVPGSLYIQEMNRLNTWTASFHPGGGGGAGGAGAGAGAGGGAEFGSGRRVTVTLQVPCTLWGRAWLQSRGHIQNDHDIMAALAYLRRCGRRATVRTVVDANSYRREFTII